jgi:hypothetical protein
VTKGTPFRARAITISNPPTAVHLSSKRGQAVRVTPTPTVGLTKKSPQINHPTRPATATGRIASTSRTRPVSATRILARPATSTSLRLPPAVTKTVKVTKKLQTGAMPSAADPEIVFEFGGMDVEYHDFMFDV